MHEMSLVTSLLSIIREETERHALHLSLIHIWEERPENKPIPARLEKQTGTEPFLHTAQETNGNGESSPHR